MCKKWNLEVFLHADFVTPRQGQGQWEWYKMVEVNGAQTYGSYEKIWSTVGVQYPTLKFFPRKAAHQTDTTRYIDPYDMWIKICYLIAKHTLVYILPSHFKQALSPMNSLHM